MKLPPTNPQALQHAMDKFDAEVRETAEWEKWQEDENHDYALERNSKLYPVKLIVSLATGVPVNQFSGGNQANNFVKKYGLQPIEIPRALASIRATLEEILMRFEGARKEPFGKSNSIWPFFKVLKRSLSAIETLKAFSTMHVKWSVGAGGWVSIPWVAILDERETDTPRRGVYCVFLFRANMTGVYLTLNQGVQELNEEKGRTAARKIYHEHALNIRKSVSSLQPKGFRLDDEINLEPGTPLGEDYQLSTIAYKFYEKGHVPDDDQLKRDLDILLLAYANYLASQKLLLMWRRTGPDYDLELENPGDLDRVKLSHLFETFRTTENKMQPGFSPHIQLDLKNWIDNPDRILGSPAYVSLSNWFLTSMDAFSGSARGKAAAELWDYLFLCRPKSRLSSSASGMNQIVIPEKFDEWWAEQLRLQGSKHEETTKGDVGMTVPLNLILYGPPGTGKTFLTMRKAVEVCDRTVPDDPKAVQIRFEQLRKLNRIEFITFHQSYGYEDFVEGIRPILGLDGGEVRYECHDGVFKRICALAKIPNVQLALNAPIDLSNVQVWKMSLGDTTQSKESEIYEQCIEKGQLRLGYGRNLDFSGCDDRDAVAMKLKEADPNIKETDFNIQAVHRFKNEMRIGDLVVVSDGNHAFRAIGKVSGNYSPLPAGSNYRQMRPVEWLLVLDESLPVERILTCVFSQATIYQLRPKVLRAEALHTLLSEGTKSSENHVLVIDEINRGNISKIFGELITLIETDKRLGAENELRAILPYSGESFGVPQQLYIIGTMNTADRSIAFLDSALRRRFRFEEMMPSISVVKRIVPGKGVIDSIDVAALLERINERIQLLFDRDHQIGHSYFLGVKSLVELYDVFRYQVTPLLQEYFYNDWQKICSILGCPHDPQTGNTKNPFPLISVRLLDEKLLGSVEIDSLEPRFSYEPNETLRALNAGQLRECFQWVYGGSQEMSSLNAIQSQ